MSEFVGTERFSIKRRLGAGAFGVVYEAHDHERGEPVALKTVLHVDATGLYRFKQEFRSLADVVHPNLVTLHELVAVDDRLFFTMDLVRGVDFLAWVRPAVEIGFDATVQRAEPSSGNDDPERAERPAPTMAGLDVPRLRSAMQQLAQGVVALHDAGKMHRDLKPSNVMVTDEGRVVLLDFGLVADARPGRVKDSMAQRIVGTPWYMAPEQGRGAPATVACDWYAVGVMLYEALTGVLPFDGVMANVIVAKITRDARRPRELVPGVPEDLDALCTALLARAPDARPRGDEVLRRLGVAGARAEGSLPPDAAPVLVGRGAQLAVLERAWATMREGEGARVVHVHGRSGMGKSALVRAFLDGVARVPGAVVLEGRVYERESVPYKALDSLVDAVARQLRALDDEGFAAGVLPRDIGTLARLFPVLRRVDAVDDAPRPEREVVDPHELRRRAASALRELLRAMGARAPLVLVIDDVQWGDVDSAALLLELVRPPHAPSLLLVLAHRDEDASSSELLAAIREGIAREISDDVAVEALAPEDARELALRSLGARDAAARALADAIARESRGSPFFVDELVRAARAGAAVGTTPDDVSLDRVLLARLEQLDADARALLEAVALVGRPVAQPIVVEATNLGVRGASALARLRAQHLVRTRPSPAGHASHDEIECYHDRVRETAAAHLAPEAQRALHARLAESLERADGGDPEELSMHLRGAGERVRAAQLAVIAATRASAALAFDRAAGLLRFALDAGGAGDDPQAQRALTTALGDALTNAGRSAEAGRAYLAAAEGAAPDAAIELQRRGAEQLLVSGELEEGLAALAAVQARFGLAIATSPVAVVARLLWYRGRLRVRGLGFRARPEAEISRETLTRMDTFWSLARGLAMVDTLRAAEFQTRNLLLALAAGERSRIARALGVEAGFVASGGGASARRVARLLAASRALAEQIDDPHARALSTLSAGLAEFLAGRFGAARGQLADAETMLRERCAGVAWERSNAELYATWTLYYLGELGELATRVPELVRSAEDRGDRYTASTARTALTNSIWLAADDPAAAQRAIDDAMAPWATRGFHMQHYFALHAGVNVRLYQGDAAGALALLDATTRSMRRSLLLQVQFIRCEFLYLRARAALSAAARARDPRALVQRAARAADALTRERMPWSAALGALARAGVARSSGRDGDARVLYGEAAARLRDAGMKLFEAAATRRAGEVTEGARGAAAVAEVDAWMRTQGIVRPERFVDVLAAGARVAGELPAGTARAATEAAAAPPGR